MFGLRVDLRVSINALCIAALIAANGRAEAQDEIAVPDSPALEPVGIENTLLDFITGKPIAKKKAECKIDPLLKKPFAKADPKSAKGLAAKIRQQELDAKNRILAAQYLGTLDCQRFPEAQEKLIGLMQEDPFEEVRYEAVMALRMMLMRGMRADEDCNECPCDECKARRKELELAREETEEHAKKAKKALKPKPCGICGLIKAIPKALAAPLAAPKKWIQNKKFGKPEERRLDYCKGCCNDKVLNALSAIAYETDDQGCPIEPSMRVREAARSALMLCPCCPGIECPPDQSTAPVPAPAPEEKKPEEAKEKSGEEATEDSASGEATTATAQPTISLASYANEKHPPIKALRDFCIVGLKQRRFNKINPNIRAIHAGRTYFFASLNAKAKFVQSPEYYAPAYCGMDPVVYVKTGNVVEGTYLREFKNRFYLFATKDNWSAFLDQTDELAVPVTGGKTVASAK